MNYFQQQKHEQKDIVNVYIPANDQKMVKIDHRTYATPPKGLSDESIEAWVKMKRNELNG